MVKATDPAADWDGGGLGRARAETRPYQNRVVSLVKRSRKKVCGFLPWRRADQEAHAESRRRVLSRWARESGVGACALPRALHDVWCFTPVILASHDELFRTCLWNEDRLSEVVRPPWNAPATTALWMRAAIDQRARQAPLSAANHGTKTAPKLHRLSHTCSTWLEPSRCIAEHGTWSGEHGAGSMERGAGSGEHGAWSMEHGAGLWLRSGLVRRLAGDHRRVTHERGLPTASACGDLSS
jgi:hypothetical protein